MKYVWIALAVLVLGLGVNELFGKSFLVNSLDMTPGAVTLHTNHGDIAVKLYHDKTPKTAENFYLLAKEGKYNNTPFHRVIENFMVQGGDYENGNGTGGKSIWGTEFEDEIVPELSHVRGVVSMANRGPGTNGSQFFIVHAPDTAYLDGKHTVFGHISKGMDVVDKIAALPTDLSDRPLEPVIIESVSLNLK